ncbi:MAG: hypothetical protein HYV29_11770 [Ignavibacteriales bacterium]|nr:hypothetical protein [Ignavibacteriales bacterium]
MKTKLFIASAICIFAVVAIVTTTSFSQSQPKTYTVKLYSGDNVVGTWTAIDWPIADGYTLVFSVGHRSTPKRVRINGTYSVEELQ